MKKISPSSFFCILVLFFAPQFLLGQNNHWQQFKTPEQINDLLETDEHLWLATNAGVIKIDKLTNAKTFFNQSTSALTDDRIAAIKQDQAGNIWLAQKNNHLAQWKNNAWEILPLPSEFWTAANITEINDLLIDDAGLFWLGHDQGVLQFDGSNWELFNHSNTNSNFLGVVFDLELDASKNLIASGITNVLFDGTDWVDHFDNNSQLFSYNKSRLFRDQNGGIWFHNFDSAIGYWNGTDWEEFTTDSVFWLPAPPEEGFENILEDQNGNILLSTAEEGIYKFENGLWILQNTTYPHQFERHSKNFYHIDNQGIKWLFNNNFLTKNQNGDFEETTIFPHQIHNNTIQGIARDQNGKLYFANGNRGNISILDGTEWSLMPTPFDTFPVYVRVNDIEFTDDNEMWVATNRGIFFYDENEWTYFTPWIVFPSNSASQIIIDNNENTWFATGDGLVKFDGTDWSLFSPDNSPLIADQVQYLALDRHGALWMKSSTATIRKWFKFDGSDWEVFDANAPAVLAGSAGAPLLDQAGDLWFPIYGGGLVRYDESEWTVFDESNTALLENFIHSTHLDEDGKLYFGTSIGVSILDGNDWNNLPATETPLPQRKVFSLLQQDGILWIGTDMNGLFAYHSEGFPTGISAMPNPASFSFSIYPNPASELINLKFENDFTTTHSRASIFTSQGQIIKDFSFGKLAAGAQNLQLNIEDLPQGIYLLRLALDEKIAVQQVIKM